MKRIIQVLTLTSLLLLPAFAQAGTGSTGIYVAPKLIVGFTLMSGMSESFSAPGGRNESWSMNDKYDTNFGGALAVGYNFAAMTTLPVRVELEYAILSKSSVSRDLLRNGWQEKGKLEFDANTLFANLYYDFYTGSMFTPYLTGGLGMAFVKTDHSLEGYDQAHPTVLIRDSSSSKSTNFAWNLGLGVGIDLDSNWTVDAGYRFVSLGEGESSGRLQTNSGNYSSSGKAENLYMHQISAGLRYTF